MSSGLDMCDNPPFCIFMYEKRTASIQKSEVLLMTCKIWYMS